MLKITNLSTIDMMQSLIKGLKDGPLHLSISKKKLRDMTNLLGRVEKYINSEKILNFVIGIEVPIHEPDSDRSMK